MATFWLCLNQADLQRRSEKTGGMWKKNRARLAQQRNDRGGGQGVALS